LNSVAAGTYAELKDQPKRLSQAFFRINALLVRTGFLLAGLLALVAPEFIRLVLGEQWLPMLSAFRLMLVFTLLDPIKATVASLFVAVGLPEKMVYARSVQMVVLVVGLFALGPRWGIAGVALAVDAMLVVGIVLLLWQARAHVDYSLQRMFVVPGFALTLGIVAAILLIRIPGVQTSDWYSGTVKTAAFSSIYSGILFLLERDEIRRMIALLKQMVSPTRRQQTRA
jgi:O-antigen/teichoic acid export membrane protein